MQYWKECDLQTSRKEEPMKESRAQSQLCNLFPRSPTAPESANRRAGYSLEKRRGRPSARITERIKATNVPGQRALEQSERRKAVHPFRLLHELANLGEEVGRLRQAGALGFGGVGPAGCFGDVDGFLVCNVTKEHVVSLIPHLLLGAKTCGTPDSRAL